MTQQTMTPAELRALSKASPLERRFDADCQQAGLPEPVKEFAFCSDRKWRVDRAWPRYRLLVEIEGGVWNQGRHTRPDGFRKDAEKYNTAASMGWTLLRFTDIEIKGGYVSKRRQKNGVKFTERVYRAPCAVEKIKKLMAEREGRVRG